jgi:molybdopterin-containing oxidoreductase family iron-sulfur binding subunit
MSDRGSSTSSEPVKSPKYIDLKDFPSVRKKVELQLRAPEGRRRTYRSLDELSDTPEFREMLNREFPQAASEWEDGVSRRNFIKLMGASLALAGLTTACAPRPVEKIVPYVQQPEHMVPGKALFYASTFPWAGFGKGVLVEQHEGRPTKIEGNPDHPSSLGAADVWGQASVLTMYDPDRATSITHNGNVSSWGAFTTSLADALVYEDWNGKKLTKRSKPARIHFLTETITSPTIKAQMDLLKTQGNISVEWHAHDAVGRENIRAGARQAFGEEVEPIYAFDAAATIVALDSNFFVDEPGSLRYARDYMENRRVRALDKEYLRDAPANRLYAIESTPTLVGAMADVKMRVRPSEVHAFAAALHQAVAAGKAEGVAAPKGSEKWFGKLVDELLANKGRSLVIAGEYAPIEVHVLAHAINAALGNIATGAADAATSAAKEPATQPATRPSGEGAEPAGHPEGDHVELAAHGKPVSLIPVVEASPANGVESLKNLVDAINAGSVDLLFILGGNPAYSAPADLNFEQMLQGIYPDSKENPNPYKKGKFFAAYLGLYEDETARQVEWCVPETHYFEAWGDIRAHDGTASIIQPLIAPLYQACRSPVELLATLIERVTGASVSAATQPATQPAGAQGSTSGYEIVRGTWFNWLTQNGGGDFEKFWMQSLHDGVVGFQKGKPATTAFAPKAVTFKGDAAKASQVPAPTDFTLIIRPDPNVWDGHLANNSWLQELPKPLTKITWDNALLISPGAAKALELASDDKGHVFRAKYTEANGKTMDVTVGGRTLKGVPVWVLPGHPDKCATLYLGYGRRAPGLRVAKPEDGDLGFNAYTLRSSDARWNITNATWAKAGGTYKLAVTQNHQVINKELNHERELVIQGDSIREVAAEYAEEFNNKQGTPLPKSAPGAEHKPYNADENLHLARRVGLPIIPDEPALSPVGLFPANPDQGAAHDNNYAAWGMVIDQTACIGCQACVMACNAENNVPVVGKEQVINEREMHWLRIDTYYVGRSAEPDAEKNDPHGHSNTVEIADPEKTYFQPLPCMQCEKAPCELVCPVGATVHSKEGLNDMAYNRCVGTRYCSNNCPYKVRRFNFLKYQDDSTPVLKLLRNPDVTVRSRGVMEKCTYCVQRISRGRIEAKKAEVKLLDGGASPEVGMDKFNEVLREIKTACQQSCPTQAIIFGNMADPKSPIFQLKREPVGFHYGLLAEINTRPRTTYLARIDNPQHGEKKPEHA